MGRFWIRLAFYRRKNQTPSFGDCQTRVSSITWSDLVMVLPRLGALYILSRLFVKSLLTSWWAEVIRLSLILRLSCCRLRVDIHTTNGIFSHERFLHIKYCELRIVKGVCPSKWGNASFIVSIFAHTRYRMVKEIPKQGKLLLNPLEMKSARFAHKWANLADVTDNCFPLVEHR